jgi:hypothetical protein
VGEGAWERWRGPNRGEASGNCCVERGADAARPSGAAGLIEVELGYGLGVGRIEGGRLVEVVRGERIHRSHGIGVEFECGLGRSACGGESRRGVRQVEVAEDGARGFGVGKEGENAHLGSAVGAAEREDLVDAGEELGPAGAGCGAGESGGWVLVGVCGCLVARSFWRALIEIGRGGVVAAEGDDPAPEARVGGEDAVVPVAVEPGRRDQAGESVEEFEGGEGEDRTAVGGGAGRLVVHATDTGVCQRTRMRSASSAWSRLRTDRLRQLRLRGPALPPRAQSAGGRGRTGVGRSSVAAARGQRGRSRECGRRRRG